MIVVFKGIKYDNVLVFDAEYNEGELIQFSGILFRKIERDIFQVSKSLNIYVKLRFGKINPFIERFTGISDIYLNTFGEEFEDARQKIFDLLEIEGSLVLVSHGLTNDRRVMLNSDIDLYIDKNDKAIDGLCTYNAAKCLLGRTKKLSLEDVAADAGIFLSNGHNAFDDAWATVSVFSLLCKLEEERKNEKILPPRKDANN